MIHESYPLITDEKREVFIFESVGPKGRVRKVVIFDQIRADLWNLGFGDLLEHGWDDFVITNNGDLVRVISTVAQAIYQFSERWPERRILINPVDEKRKQLYNTIFKRRHQEVSDLFEIKGIEGETLRSYEPHILFDVFLLIRKKSLNL